MRKKEFNYIMKIVNLEYQINTLTKELSALKHSKITMTIPSNNGDIEILYKAELPDAILMSKLHDDSDIDTIMMGPMVRVESQWPLMTDYPESFDELIREDLLKSSKEIQITQGALDKIMRRIQGKKD